MSTETLNLIQSIGILITASIMIWQTILQRRQIRTQIQQNKATTSAILSNKNDEINRLILQYHDQWKNLDKSSAEKILSGSPDLREPLCDILFTLFEQVYLQFHKYEAMDEADVEIWTRVMKDTFDKPFVKEYWKEACRVYDTGYVNFIEQKVL